MATTRKRPIDPVKLASTVMVLRDYGAQVEPDGEDELAQFNHFSDVGLSPDQAKAIANRFYAIKPAVRQRYFGPLGDPEATLDLARSMQADDTSARSQTVIVRPVNRPELAVTGLQPVLEGNPGSGGPPPVFGINFKGMHCVDETHWDRIGSDEIYIVTAAMHITPLQEGQKDRELARTVVRHPAGSVGRKTYGDVDSGETRVGPVAPVWDARWGEFEDEVSLTTVFMERDFGDPDHFRDEVKDILDIAAALAKEYIKNETAKEVIEKAVESLTDFINWLLPTDDDEIGTVTTVLSQFDIVGYPNRPLKEFVRVLDLPFFDKDFEIKTGLMHHFMASVNDNDYFAAYEVVKSN